jgi:phosphoribosylformylglycinamidine synthase
MDLKEPEASVFLLGPKDGAREALQALQALPPVHRALAGAVSRGLVSSCHDASDGGALVAAAEMCIGSGLGMAVLVHDAKDAADVFGEAPGRYLVEVGKKHFAGALKYFESHDVSFKAYGRVLANPHLVVSEANAIVADIPVDEMTKAWRGTLDW